MKDCENAMALYPLTTKNKEKLRGCEFIETRPMTQFKGVMFIFNDSYRKLNIALVYTNFGETLITDYYGETMKINDVFFIRLGN